MHFWLLKLFAWMRLFTNIDRTFKTYQSASVGIEELWVIDNGASFTSITLWQNFDAAARKHLSNM